MNRSMFKRQILLLAMLEDFGGALSNTEMQKYLFLLTRFQDKRSYHFIPYKFGCFSFNSYSDKRKLIGKGILKDSDDWILSKNQPCYYLLLSPADRSLVKRVTGSFGQLHGKELIRYVYLNYPYYSLNSEILGEVLSRSEIAQIKTCLPQKKNRSIYTIGYEGRSLEEYINCLIKEDIKILFDLRKNPISMKYGFSKKTLSKALETVKIGYKHFPGLGIPGKYRVNLHDLASYNKLFDYYEKEVLSSSHSLLEMIYRSILINDRVGLTCFEKLPEYCHRTRVARAITNLFDRELSIIEL